MEAKITRRQPEAGRRALAAVNAARQEATAAWDVAAAPILQELACLSPQRVAFILRRRGYGPISYKRIERARHRLGLPDWRHAVPDEAADAVEPRRRSAPKKAREEVAAE